MEVSVRVRTSLAREVDGIGNWMREFWIINGTNKSDFSMTSVVYCLYARYAYIHPCRSHAPRDNVDTNTVHVGRMHASSAAKLLILRAECRHNKWITSRLERNSDVSVSREQVRAHFLAFFPRLI